MTDTEKRTVNRWNKANVIAVIGLAASAFMYAENRYQQLMTAINSNHTENAVLQVSVNNNAHRIDVLEAWRQTFFDKPRPISIVKHEQ